MKINVNNWQHIKTNNVYLIMEILVKGTVLKKIDTSSGVYKSMAIMVKCEDGDNVSITVFESQYPKIHSYNLKEGSEISAICKLESKISETTGKVFTSVSYKYMKF